MKNTITCNKALNSTIDILKFVLSLFVVAIHTVSVPSFLIPVLRTAVPIFFLISSYFFFQNKTDLKSFVKRNLKLYIFWLVIQCPVVLYLRGYHTMGLFTGVMSFVRDFVFGSTFRASWFLMANMIAIALLSRVPKKVPASVLFISSGVIYLLCCLFSNYYAFVEHTPIETAYEWYCSFIHTPFNSFPVALFWCALGKNFAATKPFNKFVLIVTLLTSFALLMVEHYFIQFYSCSAETDCYLLLPPVCICVFLLAKDHLQLCFPRSSVLRKCSTIIYASHATVAIFVNGVLNIFFSGCNDFFIYALILIMCLCLSACLIFLQKKRGFAWLRYAW